LNREQPAVRVHPAVIDFDGPIVIVGFGSIGKGSLPLILRHIHADRERMVVIDPNDSARRLCELEGVRFEQVALTPDNYREILTPIVSGGYLVNLSVDVSSAALIRCAARSTRSTSTPASSRGPAATSTTASRCRCAPTTRCARRCARSAARARPR
jgi:hypothetical protein